MSVPCLETYLRRCALAIQGDGQALEIAHLPTVVTWVQSSHAGPTIGWSAGGGGGEGIPLATHAGSDLIDRLARARGLLELGCPRLGSRRGVEQGLQGHRAQHVCMLVLEDKVGDLSGAGTREHNVAGGRGNRAPTIHGKHTQLCEHSHTPRHSHAH